jgi:ABC-type nickel/cobalt efflux system permease component RcnA
MFVGCVMVVVLGLGWGVNALWPSAGSGAAMLHEHDEPSLLSLASAVVLGGLFVVSLLRQGPRGFLGRLWELGGHNHTAEHDDHAHDGHAHAHDGHAHTHDEHAHTHDEHGKTHEEPASRPGGCCH